MNFYFEHKANQDKTRVIIERSLCTILTYLLTDEGMEFWDDEGMAEDVEALLREFVRNGYVN